MKLYSKIFLFGGVCAMGLLNSCSSDEAFLEEQPKSTLTITNAFNNSDNIIATLLSAYNEYSELFFGGPWGQGINVTRAAGTDIYDGNDQSTHYSNFTGFWSTDAGFVKNVWDKYYKMISYCNLALSQVDNVTWSNDAEKAQVIAEAHFLRGLSYLRLAEHFGGVPLVMEYSENPRYDYTRSTRAEVYDAAISELKMGYEGLPGKVAANQYGRAGKGAAALYLAEACLAQGVEKKDNSFFTQAKDYAKEVTDLHPLMKERFGIRTANATGSRNGIDNAKADGNVYFDLFVSDNMVNPANTEAVWVIPSAPDYATYNANGGAGRRENNLDFTPAVQDLNWDPKYVEAGAGQGPWKAVSAKYGSKTSPDIHGGYGWGLTPCTWFASYDLWNEQMNGKSADMRYAEGITVRTRYMCLDDKHSLYEKYAGWEHIDKADMNGSSKFYPIFYKQVPLDAWDYDLADPGFWGQICYTYRNKYANRSAEAYLLQAEACVRLGDTAGALDALNKVRTRANAEPFTSVDIQIVMDERARELMYEEDRWATFLRLQPEEWKTRIKNYSMYNTNAGAKVYPEVRRWAEFTQPIQFNLWPIPQTYIDLNTGAELTQNEGWK